MHVRSQINIQLLTWNILQQGKVIHQEIAVSHGRYHTFCSTVDKLDILVQILLLCDTIRCIQDYRANMAIYLKNQ
jgi:hypothetical protein